MDNHHAFELGIEELDTISGGASSLDDIVKQIVLLTNTLRNINEMQISIIKRL